MSDICIKQMPAFKKAYKKLPRSRQLMVNDAIKAIIQNPELGDEKREDLSSVYTYKFKIHHQEFLLAYEWDSMQRLLLALGVHEKFFVTLKEGKS